MKLFPLAGCLVVCFCSGLLCAEDAPTADADVFAKKSLEVLWEAGEFTEGVAAGPDGKIYFSDIPDGKTPGRVLVFDPETSQTTVFNADSGKSNGLMFDAQGRLIAACGADGGRRSLSVVTADSVEDLATTYKEARFNSPNDLVIHPSGEIYFSDPRYVGKEPREIPSMCVYCYIPKFGDVVVATSRLSKPNGLILSPQGDKLYAANTDDSTSTMTLNVFDIHEDGTLGTPSVLVDFGTHSGIDGMTIDDQGRIYAAVRDSDRFGIRVYTPNGKEIAALTTPELPTNCCFGRGEEISTLYITAGGGLYRIRLDVKGYHSVNPSH